MTAEATFAKISPAETAETALNIFNDAMKTSERDSRPMYKTVLVAIGSIESRTGVDLTVARNAVNNAASFHFLGTVGPQALPLLRKEFSKIS